MYAIVEISGKQFKVEKKQKIFVNKLDVAEGKKVSFDNVLMINDGSKSSIGTPKVSGAQVAVTVEVKLNGLPTARTHSPIIEASLSPNMKRIILYLDVIAKHPLKH